MPVSVQDLGVDALTVVGHKFYGPRIGALYVRGLGTEGGAHLDALFQGGGQVRKRLGSNCCCSHGCEQERGYRPGTENTPMIAGLGMVW